MGELLLSTCLNAELLYQQREATSFLTVSRAEQIIEFQEDSKILSINSNIHYTDAHQKKSLTNFCSAQQFIQYTQTRRQRPLDFPPSSLENIWGRLFRKYWGLRCAISLLYP